MFDGDLLDAQMHGWSTAAVLVSALCSAALLLDLLLLEGARTVLTFVACAQARGAHHHRIA